MPDPQPGTLPTLAEVERLARRWFESSLESPLDRGAERLAALLRDPRGLEFAVGFVDRVIRPEDPRVAARDLERLSRRLPAALPWYLRAAVSAGGGFGVLLPGVVIPVARAVFRRMVRHLVVEAAPARLDHALARLRHPGIRLDVHLLGETVLGEREARRRLEELAQLLARPDVNRLTLTVPEIAGRGSRWGFDADVDRAVERLLPLYRQAARSRDRKLLTLALADYRDLDLTIAVFIRLLSEPELRGLEAGIVLPSALPEGLPALERLLTWGRERVAGGGAGIRVRLVKGAHLAEERVEAALRGWLLAAFETKAETDAQYLRMLDRALRPENTDAVRVGVASHNLFDLAFAHLLARARGVSGRADVEMLLGMAPELVDAVGADTGGVVLATPVVPAGRLDSAVPSLVRRLEELASAEHFLAALADLDEPGVFAREAARFADSLAALDDPAPTTRRREDRSRPDVPRAPDPFVNEADTDPSVPGNRVWARGILERARGSRLGNDTLATASLADAGQVRDRVRRAAGAGADWGRTPGHRRAEHLDRAGEVLAAYRGRLIEVMVSEIGATLADADTAVSTAVDFAHYYAARARELADIRGAVFRPVALTVVASSRVLPVSAAAGSVLAALAAGSAVLLKPAPQAVRSGAVLAEALWEAGIPRDVLGLVDVEEGETGRALVTAPEVGRVLLTGSFETAALFRSWRADLPLLADTSATNAIVVTPSADHDRALADLVESAFGGAGQRCSAVSLAILVGSVGTSQRFRRRLVDAVTSLAVGSPFDPAAELGPLIAPPGERLAYGLGRLGEGESWLVTPRRLDESGRLWAPGIRDGVRPGSVFHRTEFPGPVLGIMTAATLEEAIALQNGADSGLSAGLHSLDPHEVATWLEGVEAGSLTVNRAPTGTVVGRRPVGGWKRSAVGPGAAAGGPNTLLVLGDWEPDHGEPVEDLRLDGIEPRVRAVIEAFQPVLDFARFDRVRRAALSDEQAWATEFGLTDDPTALGVERNLRRYRPADIVVRLGEGGDLGDLARILCAGVRARARMLVSTATPLPSGLLPLVDDGTAFGRSPLGILGVQVESDDAFRARCDRGRPARVRLIGSGAGALAETIGGSPDVAVWFGPVTLAGRIELLPFVREQSVSMTAHRYGMPDRDLAALVV